MADEMPRAKFYRVADLKEVRVGPLQTRQGIPGIGVNVLYVKIKKGNVFPMHRHVNEQFTIVLEGTMKFTFDDGSKPILVGPGEVIHIPGNVPHGVEALADVIEYDVFSPARNNLVTDPE